MSDASSQDAGPEERPPPRSGRPVSVYLLGLVMAILIPALAVALVLLNRTNDAQQDVLQGLTNATVQAMGHSVDREITGMATTLRVLSTSLALRDGDLAGFHERATKALVGTGAYLVAVDEDLQQVLNTRVPFGTELPVTSDPETARARCSGVSRPFRACSSAGGAALCVQRLDAGERSPGVPLIAMTQNASNLVPALQSRQLPTGWHAALVDTDNHIIRRHPRCRSRDRRGAARAAGRGESANWAEERLNGENVVTAEWRSG